jgi:aminopeptidase YwaD
MRSARFPRIWLASVVVLVLVSGGCARHAPPAAPSRQAPAIDRWLPASAERAYRDFSRRFEPARAMEVVRYMDQFWRLPGNPGFDQSEEQIRRRLVAAGFQPSDSPGPAAGARPLPRVWYEEIPGTTTGWEPIDGTVWIAGERPGEADEIVISRERDWIALCMNSFSTPPGGVTAPLVWVGRGAEASDYEGVDVKGAVVVGEADMRRLWTAAVRTRGAIGVISTAPPPSYTRPAETPDVFQWGGIPYDETLKSFGFKASRRVAERLKQRLAQGRTSVRVVVATRFHRKPNRTLVAEIPGRTRPDQHVVLVAHVQEPGANDNASGCGTLVEIARVMAAARAAGSIPAPARTVTFLWGNEIQESQQWLKADAARAKQVRYAFSLDMTGEDTTRTGGTFLVEKMPDPSAVWARPSDPHTEWGASPVRKETIKGNLLDDLHLAICLRRARDTGWVVRTNPYEGGSDHSVFLAAGIPAVLDWHFPDRYYHTNLDRPDMTSPLEMANVGVAVATTTLLLASAGEDDARAVAELVAAAAAARLDLEQRQSVPLIQAAKDRAAAETTEAAVFEAWKGWYTQALESVLDLPVAPASPALRKRIEARIAEVMARARKP